MGPMRVLLLVAAAVAFLVGCEDPTQMADYRDGRAAGVQLWQEGRPAAKCLRAGRSRLACEA